MLKAILADDEEIVRTSIAKWLPWKELGIELAGTASDGEEALSMIMEIRPDIIITDIRMPKMDGLELIRRISARLQDSEFIILSGFGEFSYAQTAMQYGVKHYLLKPARKEDLVRTLEEARKDIEDRRRARIASVPGAAEHYGLYLQRGMMVEVLSDPSSVDDVVRRCRRLSSFDPGEILTAIVSQVLSPARFAGLMMKTIAGMGIRMPMYPVSAAGRVFIVLDLPSLSGLEAVRKAVEEKGAVLVAVKRGTPSELITAFVEYASGQKEASIYAEDGSVETVKVSPSSPDADELGLIRRYRSVMNGAGDPGLMDDISSVFSSMPFPEARLLFLRMAIGEVGDSLLFKELADFASAVELITLARGFLEHRVPRERDPFPIDTVLRYIKENYQNPDISLKWISENVVYMNSEYLSRLFLREVGQRFTDYLNSTRIEEARKLMEAYHRSTVSEIAEKVGYSNPGYFFHVFRRYTGMTPGEYMEKEASGKAKGN